MNDDTERRDLGHLARACGLPELVANVSDATTAQALAAMARRKLNDLPSGTPLRRQQALVDYAAAADELADAFGG